MIRIAKSNQVPESLIKTCSYDGDDVKKQLRRDRCIDRNYADDVKFVAAGQGDSVCYNVFTGYGNDGMVWANYPKVSVVTYCDDGTDYCKNKKTKSNFCF